MDWKALLTVFCCVFIAELGDKTQLATLLFATDKSNNRWLIFLAASAALITATGIAILAGQFMSQYITERQLSLVAGLGFIAIGMWFLFGK
jgi:putative Ca2+/H+ antiporter (TMEM165/GDT1 family)